MGRGCGTALGVMADRGSAGRGLTEGGHSRTAISTTAG